MNHYQKMRQSGHLETVRTYRRKQEQCLASRCTTFQIAKGYCYRHYQQIRRHGRLTPEKEKLSPRQK